ncbi:ABC transporter ATP-binding protein [Alkalibacterium sp. 20]|nr:ABC transporter ATP-binding protein [Alkalibacterium sp. 20]
MSHILEMKNIIKEFSGVRALSNVNFKVNKGEIHALVGENGAGKSTLMKVLSGVYTYGEYSGDIVYKGDVSRFKNIKESEEKGIVIIHQELALVPYMSIADNIFLGNEQATKGIVNKNITIISVKELLKTVGLKENPTTLIKDIGVGKQQLVEIAKAFSKKVELLILDEPTASLNENDSENLLELLKEFKKEGITSIIISHKLNEVIEVADNVTILRDGETIETLSKEKNEISEDRIIKGMVGRSLDNRFPKHTPNEGQVALEVNDWTVHNPIDTERIVINNVSFKVNNGEILGFAGLMGAGRTELVKSVFGKSYGKNISGELIKDGKPIKLKNPREAILNGLAYVTEDRKGDGLILIQDILNNISIASLEKVSKNTVIDKNRELERSREYKKKLNIKSTDVFQRVDSLSGGNQQKVVLSRWIATEPDILFLDEPTRGIDVGAKYEIYKIIQDLADQGKAIVVISSELPELMGISDRVYTMNEGTITGEFKTADVNQEKLMEYMTMSVNKKGA